MAKKISKSKAPKKLMKETEKEPELQLLSEKTEKHNDKATAKNCINDLRELQKLAPKRFITRQFYRSNGGYSDATWNQYFGSWKEFRKQAKLELSRQQQKMERDIAKHASHDHYRQFFSSKVLPYHEKYNLNERKKKKFKSIVIVSDIHDIECDRFALSVFLDYIKRVKPDHICFAGDIYDMPEFSYWGKDPRDFKIKDRYDFVDKEIFGPTRKFCPNAQIDLVIGNHEYRLLRMMADATPNLKVLLSDVMGLSLTDLFQLDKFKINLISKLDLHAYNKSDIKDQIKNNYKVYYDCFVVAHKQDYGFGYSGCSGHHHRLAMSSDRNLPSGVISWVKMSGLHKLDADYHEGLNNWNLGFNHVIINQEEKTVVQQPILIQENWGVVNGIIYERKV